MVRRGHECRCCAGCDKCTDTPSLLVVAVDYPPGSGVMVDKNTMAKTFPAPSGFYTVDGWEGVTTTCSVPVALRGPASIRITDGGSGYTSPPLLTLSGGGGTPGTTATTIQSIVKSITVTNGGSGYTSAPTVSFSVPAAGGQITKAVALAVVRGKATGAVVTNQGSGYLEAPSISAAEGTGLQATAVMSKYYDPFDGELRYKVSAVTIQNGGSGYQPDALISFEGGEGTGAAGRLTVEGSVEEIQLLNRGLYRNTRQSASGTSIPDWPTISISGNATAVPVFDGKVVAAEAAGTGYTSAPSVAFSGGGGTGAAGLCELNWEASHERTAELVNCVASVDSTFTCLDADSTKFPPPHAVADCGFGHAEYLSWQAQAITSLAGGVSVGDPTLAATSSSFYFDGEAVRALDNRTWEVLGDSPETADRLYFRAGVARKQITRHYRKRLFSRIAPSVTYRIKSQDSPATTNAAITPTFRQYVDAKGDSFWYLESLAVSNGGDNLGIPAAATAAALFADGNTDHELTVNATFTRQAIVFSSLTLDEFSTQPQLSVETSEVGTTGFFEVSSVTVSHGGQTTLPDQNMDFNLDLAAGHGDFTIVVRGVISSGQLQSVSILQNASISPPARLTSVTLPADPYFNSNARITTGKSSFAVTRSHSQPTVNAELTGSPTEAANVSVALENKADLNGDGFWAVKSVSVDSKGKGYDGTEQVLFTVDAPSIEAVPAIGSVVLERELPTLTAAISSAFGVGAVVQATLAEKSTLQDDKYWEVSSVEIKSGGGGYQTGEGVTFAVDPPGTEDVPAVVTITANQTNVITGVTVTSGGRYYQNTDRVGRVQVDGAGAYFIRTLTETSTALPEVSCIGEISVENGWELNQQEIVFFSGFRHVPIEVGQQFDIDYQSLVPPTGFSIFPTTSRTRVCELPNITLEFR